MALPILVFSEIAFLGSVWPGIALLKFHCLESPGIVWPGFFLHPIVLPEIASPGIVIPEIAFPGIVWDFLDYI